MLKWRYRGLDVFYKERLNGFGTGLARPFARFVKRHYPQKRFVSVFEWCAGPGFIGFALLRDRLCDHLCLADINGDAIDCVARTVRHNGLRDRVSFYCSDNCAGLPADERFDLVVANPPGIPA